jgi:hypothetical protein
VVTVVGEVARLADAAPGVVVEIGKLALVGG